MKEVLISAVVKMKSNKITQKEVSTESGLSEQWISAIFNGKRESDVAEEKILKAIDSIIAKRKLLNLTPEQHKSNKE